MLSRWIVFAQPSVLLSGESNVKASKSLGEPGNWNIQPMSGKLVLLVTVTLVAYSVTPLLVWTRAG